MTSTLSHTFEKLLETFISPLIVGRKDGVEEEENYMEYDITRHYTNCMVQITHIPKFTYFDQFTPIKSILSIQDFLSSLTL